MIFGTPVDNNWAKRKKTSITKTKNKPLKYRKMKTMKILLAAIVFAGFTINGYSQDPEADASAEASANVVVGIEIDKDTDINFGNIAQNTTAVLDPTDEDGNSNVGLDGSAVSIGKFTVTGANGAGILISDWDTQVTMYLGGWDGTGDAPAQTLTMNSTVVYDDSDTGEYGEDASPVNSTNVVNLNSGGNGYIWVGGNIEVGNADAGTYEGDFNITVEYN